MIESFRVGARQLRARLQGGSGAVSRLELDLSLRTVGLGVLALVAVMTLVPAVFAVLDGVGPRLIAAVLVAIAAFFFVTVSSRIVGLVGVTSNPTSGMTIATLLATSGLFLLLGWSGDMGKVAALTIGCVVAIAASIAGDTSQDLKTGFLLGATPRTQQLGELAGVLTSAVFVCLTVTGAQPVVRLRHRRAAGAAGDADEDRDRRACWTKRCPGGSWRIGAGIALVAELFRIPSLPFAVGVYLPVSTMTPLFIGGLMRHFAERNAGSDEAASEARERGVLLGSGFVGGEGLLGVLIAIVAVVLGKAPGGIGEDWAGAAAPWFGLAAFILLVSYLWFQVRRRAAG